MGGENENNVDTTCCINVTEVTREDSGKPPMHLDYPDKLFLSSGKFLNLSLSSQSKINVTSVHHVQSPK